LQLLELPSLPRLDILATPSIEVEAPFLMVHRSSFSPLWRGPSEAHHVLVNGLVNGWQASSSQAPIARYMGEESVQVAYRVSVVGLVVALGVWLSLAFWRPRPSGRGRS